MGTYALKIVQGVKLWRQSSVNAEKLFVHNSRQWQGTERFHACLVDILRVLVLTLQLEGEIISQMATLVVTTKKPQAVWIPDLQGPEVEHTLNGKVSAINIVSEEEVSGVRGVSADLEQLHQIVVLAVDISADGDWRIHLE